MASPPDLSAFPDPSSSGPASRASRAARTTWRRELSGGPVLALSGGADLADHTGGDVEAARAARAALAADVGVPPDRLLVARQVHGATAVLARGPWDGQPPEADAMVTDAPGLALAVLVADCVPVLLADPAAGVVAVAHAGRRGMDSGVVGAAVALMVEVGAQPSRTRAVLGPSVCGRCYEVPAAMRQEVAERHPVVATRTWTGTPALDVAAGVLEQLADLGVAAEQLPGCTVEDGALGSVRRSGPQAPRWAGLAWRRERA
ncbi:polyphenol oxidase family protein [Quadrisphaera setariae]|uniref:Polyphenol oxidase family protein n=1 Tax=Quadrisphaera setariae TaxID=2593304 RepID=A0A5C8ZCU6_9ACTN|nr:polyphenol oxidase family protein [Quadrisphaera setariae]TXR55722.1 polyphenol oxidase family protein [Quadrisphaera setariae]